VRRVDFQTCLIVGAGPGLSASLTRCFARAGMKVALGARRPEKLTALCGETGAQAFACDAASRDQVCSLFDAVESAMGSPDVVVYNAGARVRGLFDELDPSAVEASLAQTAMGGFFVAHRAVRTMLRRKSGAILFTGASASVKGYARSAPFAMGKFALRGLAQSMARELAPKGIHVAHFVIDGAIGSSVEPDASDDEDSMLDPDAIAATYLHVLQQPRSAWTWEVELRPWRESF